MSNAHVAVIDPNRTWAQLERRLVEESDPILRRNLRSIVAHQKAEALGDLDGLMATLSPEPVYRMGPPDISYLHPRGTAEVRAYYAAFIASGASRLQHEFDRIAVDRKVVLTDGLLRMAYPGTTLAARGIAVDNPSADAYYLWEARMAIVWVFDDQGRIIGEESYADRDGFAGIAERPLAAAAVVPLRD